mgnify:CR=1 FL=1
MTSFTAAVALFACGGHLAANPQDDASTKDVSADGTVLDAAKPIAAPWPMVAHDARRTSRSSVKGPRVAHIRWRYPMTNSGSSPAVAADGTIFVTNQSSPGTLLAIHSDGTLAWSLPGVGPYASPMIGADGTIYLDGSSSYDPNQLKWPGDILVAVDPVTHQRKWAYADYAGVDYSDNALTPGQDGIVFGVRSGIYGIHPDGSLAFHLGRNRQGPDNGDTATPRLAVSGGLVIGGIGNDKNEAGTFALTADGAAAWTLDGSREGLVATDGTFFGITRGGLDAISPTGVLLWHLTLAPRSPPIEGPTGTIYMRTETEIVSIDPKSSATQTVVGALPVKQQGLYPLVIDSEGVIYYVDKTRVTAIGAKGNPIFYVDLSDGDGGTDYVDTTSLALSEGVLYVAAYQHLIAIGL